MRSVVYSLITIATLVALQGRALADLDTPYIAPKLMLGFGGEHSVESSFDGVTSAIDQKLEPSYGVGLAGFNPMGLFALGGQLSLMSWGDTADRTDRTLLFEVSALPQLNLALAIVEVYLNVPIGLTLDFAGEDAYGPGYKVGTGLGYHLGLMLGLRVGLGDLGLLAELGYVYRAFSREVESELTGATSDWDIDFGQAALNVGVYF